MAAPASPAAPKDDDVATEKQWLVGTYLPSLLPNIKSAILEAQEILSFPAHSVKLVSLKSTDGSIHGAYRLAGSGIFEAEISIRHSPEKKTGTAQFNTEINTTHPYQLHQLQDATNHLSLALSALEEVLSTQNSSFSVAQRALQDVHSRLKAAEQSINAPSHRCFPSVISPQCTLFPPLPPEVILEFSLHNHRLITRSYYLSISNKPRASPLQAPRSDSSGLLGQSFKYRDVFVEVLSVATAETDVADLVNGLAATGRALNICKGLLDNMAVLQSLSAEGT